MTREIDEAVKAMSRARAGTGHIPARGVGDLVARKRAGTITEAELAWLDDLTSRPTAEDFRSVGVVKGAAEAAAAGLTEGKYISFEDACWSVSEGSAARSQLNVEAMREAGARFAGRAHGRSDLDEADRAVAIAFGRSSVRGS